MDGLNDNFILSGEEIDTLNLFEDNDETQETNSSTEENTLQVEDDNKNEEKSTTEDEVNPDDLFDSESVGSVIEKDNKELGGEPSNKGNNNSPKSNFYSSIVNALKEDGILTNLDENIKKMILE